MRPMWVPRSLFMVALTFMFSQSFLTSFFKEVSANNIGDFQNLYNALNPEEQHQLSLLR